MSTERTAAGASKPRIWFRLGLWRCAAVTTRMFRLRPEAVTGGGRTPAKAFDDWLALRQEAGDG